MAVDDWNPLLLGDVVTLQRGFDLPSRLRKRGEIPIVSSSGVTDTHNQLSVSGPGVVTGRYGTVGEVFYIDKSFWPLNTTLFVSDFKGNDPLFVYFLLKTIDYRTYSGKSGVPGVNRNDLHEISVKLPPLKEQRSIAQALSGVDALIAALEKTIAKKRAIKTATMQQLLTGKKRLPGFGEGKGYKESAIGLIPEDWNVCQLGDAVDFLDGKRKPIRESDRARMHGAYPYYGASGVVDYVNGYLFDEDLILLGEDGENIISRSVRLAFRVSGKIWVNNHAHVLKPKLDFDIGFLTEYLESLDYSIYNSGTAQPKLNQQTCQSIPLVQPLQKEQRSIAAVLSDMDAEIAAIKARLAKTQAIKQGMMQELLTGRTRLI